METRYFAQFDADGFPLGFYPSDVWPDAPAGSVEISHADWLEFIDNQGLRKWDGAQPVVYAPPAPPAPPVRIYKAAMFRAMSDGEYETYLGIRAQFPPRLQAIFDAAEYLSPDDEFWPALVEAAEQAYGPERAAEILSPNS